MQRALGTICALAVGLFLWAAPDARADGAERPAAPAAVVLPARVSARPPPATTCCWGRARGPIEIRDDWLLAQPRLTLPATTPDPLPCGTWYGRVQLIMGNDFGYSQDGAAETPDDRRFLVDGEHYTVGLTARRAISSTVDVGIRIPVRWRGAGFMDSIIDAFHDLTAPFGSLDNGRPFFDNDKFRVEGRDKDFNPLAWTDTGWGLGNIELEAHWAFHRPRYDGDVRAALIGRVGLPTGTGPFETGSVDVGVQVVAAKRLHPRWDLYGGAGGTWFSETAIEGIEYEPFRGHGFLAVEWHVARTWSLFVQSDAATRLVTNLVSYPSVQWYIDFGAKIDLGRRWEFELGFRENLLDQQTTTDIAVFFGLAGRF